MSDDLLAKVAPIEVKLNEFSHIKACLEYVGAAMIVEAMEKLLSEFPKLAGIGLAVATANVALADQRTRMLTKNIKVAMQHGMDLDNSALTMSVKKDGLYLAAIPHGDAQ